MASEEEPQPIQNYFSKIKEKSKAYFSLNPKETF